MIDDAKTLINTVSEVGNLLRKAGDGASIRSLSSATLLTRVDPLCVVSEEVLSCDFLPDVLHATTSLIAAYYISAAVTMSQVGDIKVRKVLDQLNPNRGVDTWLMSRESLRKKQDRLDGDNINCYRFALPTGNPRTQHHAHALEASKVWRFDEKRLEYKKVDYDKDEIETASGVKIEDKFQKILYEPTQLLVGKVFDLEFKVGKDTINIPITLRLNSNPLPRIVVEQIMVQSGQNMSFFGRLDATMMGELDWWDDFIMTKDVRKARRAARIADKSGVYDEIVSRVRGNRIAGLLTLAPSYNNASAVWIVSKAVLDDVASRLGGKMSDRVVREKLFDNIFAFIVIAIDTDYNTATFYYHDIPYPTTVSEKSLKAAGKGKGPDIADVLKSYTMGSAPTF